VVARPVVHRNGEIVRELIEAVGSGHGVFSPSAPDGAHRPLGLDELLLADEMAGRLIVTQMTANR